MSNFDRSGKKGQCRICGKKLDNKYAFYCEECGAQVKEQRNKELSAKAKALRAERKAQGLCPTCGDPTLPGSTLCEYHLKKQKMRIAKETEARRAKKDHTKCYFCGGEIENEMYSTCNKCREKLNSNLAKAREVNAVNAANFQKKTRKEKYQERLNAGICVECGKPSDGKRICKECSIKYKQKLLDLRRKTAAERQNKIDARICLLCGKPIEEGRETKLCEACSLKRIKPMQEYWKTHKREGSWRNQDWIFSEKQVN